MQDKMKPLDKTALAVSIITTLCVITLLGYAVIAFAEWMVR
jgi:antibiotic biosynthesis monooxygenase (ABM) superfamily enzyme